MFTLKFERADKCLIMNVTDRIIIGGDSFKKGDKIVISKFLLQQLLPSHSAKIIKELKKISTIDSWGNFHQKESINKEDLKNIQKLFLELIGMESINFKSSIG